ncbi:NAC domain-containing protein 100 [Ricinus communis]|uniref:NAC domain-containing protein, putative n=1 Tax=Ricinus communis TaxID=3988 RepID=B9T799_RICCO|nr:NAC domain-containing protein 100 [Ricinus communis]EEF28269.1 NAC domain-containing protein, putative [Ricinus communis]|eukprot:XP_002534118.1 NAC domain-containing protein 100 [Ricinus communis]
MASHVHGFRFNPTDEELIKILDRKASEQEMPLEFIVHTNLYDQEPQHLEWNDNPSLGNNERYYCCKRENDSREVAGRGWWKATSHVKKIYVNVVLVGCKRPLTFHRYRDNDRNRKNAIKTNWIMHEYSLESKITEWRLCKIIHKGKPSIHEEMENIRQHFEAAGSSVDSQLGSERERAQQECSPALPAVNSTMPSYSQYYWHLQQFPQSPYRIPYHQNLESTGYYFNEQQGLSLEPSSEEQFGGSLWPWQN